MVYNFCTALIIVGGILLIVKANQRITIWVKNVPVIRDFIERVSFPIGTGALAIGLFLQIYGYCA